MTIDTEKLGEAFKTIETTLKSQTEAIKLQTDIINRLILQIQCLNIIEDDEFEETNALLEELWGRGYHKFTDFNNQSREEHAEVRRLVTMFQTPT